MKHLKTIIPSILLIFAFVLTAESQNNSDQNSNVIYAHQTIDISIWRSCAPEPRVNFVGTLHVTRKVLPNGSFTAHYNLNLEGVDENGGIWNWNEAWNWKRSLSDGSWNHDTRNIIVVGPKGAKYTFTARFVRNGNGEVIRAEMDESCP